MNKIINKSIGSPIQVAIVSILLSIFIASGVRWFIIDDDFFKMFPKDLESRLLWEDMTSEFGDSEFLFIAFGQDEKEIYNLETISTVRALTDELEKIPIVDKVISLSTIDKIESDPEDETWLLIDKLFVDTKYEFCCIATDFITNKALFVCGEIMTGTLGLIIPAFSFAISLILRPRMFV